jgi:beta-aspartyl-peptidase (threonine type)
MTTTPAVLVHGGAGAWVARSRRLEEAVAACAHAARHGLDAMAAGRSPLDAAEAAVRVLEDAPSLNAGRGSTPNAAGVVEMDALVMDGATLALGAVAAVQRLANPVALARLVMERTPHTLLAGAGADAFADELGLERCANADLVVVREPPPAAGDTVGAVAVDAHGNLAVATSTGGIEGKRPGRVGDTRLAGSGAYADNASAAVAATGDGEALMKVVISKLACDLIAGGGTPQEAVEAALGRVVARFQAHGGLIAIDPAGRIGAVCNTSAMPYAHAAAGAGVVARPRPA